MATAKSTEPVLADLIPAGDARDALFEQFVSEMATAGLKTVEVELKITGKKYVGPAVNVRDLELARRATRLLTLTHASGADTTYVVPILEPISMDD